MGQEEFVKSILEIPEETQTIEFKCLSGSKNEVGKTVETIVAMTNTDGGNTFTLMKNLREFINSN